MFSKINFLIDFLALNPPTPNEFFIGIAAAILAMIAIVFSLAIFSIQYASEKGTTKILREYRSDRLYNIAFSVMCIFALIIFLFSILPVGPFLFWEYTLAFLFLIIILILLFLILRHTSKLVDPTYLIDLYRKRADENFEKISNSLESAYKESEKTNNKNDAKDQQAG